jgi:hypothetical protein
MMPFQDSEPEGMKAATPQGLSRVAETASILTVRNCTEINLHFQERNASIYVPFRTDYYKFIP